MQRSILERQSQESKASPPSNRDAEIRAAEPRNLVNLALHQVLLRVGWIFKTESIIIPAFLDYIVPGAALQSLLRGCLPVLNRLGQSVPPVLFARRLKLMSRKKWALTLFTLLMAVCFLALSALCFLTRGTQPAWMPWAFLALYGLFFASTGLNQLSMHTLQGKLIQAEHRGRLMTLSTTIGCPLAILAAWCLLGRWLETPESGFAFIFGASGIAFVIAACSTLCIKEPVDDFQEARRSTLHIFRAAWDVIGHDANFRKLALVAALFSTVLMLFPHYQAMGRVRLGLDLQSLLLWVIVQNAGTGVYSLVAGPIADRSGTRRVLRGLVALSAITPLLAIALAQAPPVIGRHLFFLVFLPIGLTPVTIRTLMNYTLEIAPPAEHPRYVSTLSLCLAVPVVLCSPLIGWMVNATSFEFVFASAATAILLGGLLTIRLIEPRHSRALAAENARD